MRDYIEERVMEIAAYILENNATVRDAAKVFKVSKSTVHAECSIRTIQRIRSSRLSASNLCSA